ncbi:hypothetical protein BC826DRAFT_1177873 [Russula brevipes]|nr:hypothetical protein BC826DRAFT_1177873 [Russula brevipes]
MAYTRFGFSLAITFLASSRLFLLQSKPHLFRAFSRGMMRRRPSVSYSHPIGGAIITARRSICQYFHHHANRRPFASLVRQTLSDECR